MPRKSNSTPQQVAMDVAIGQRLRSYRKARKLTQTDLGAGLGVTFQQIQKYENGRNRISGSRLIEVCKLLDVSPGQLLGTGKSNGVDPFDIAGDVSVARALNAFRLMTKEQRSHAADMVTSIYRLTTESSHGTTKSKTR